MNKTELKLWEEYTKCVADRNNTLRREVEVHYGALTVQLAENIIIKPSYEGFMDWKLERLKKEGK